MITWEKINRDIFGFIVCLSWLMVSGQRSKKPNYAVIARYAERLSLLAYEAAERKKYAWGYIYTVEFDGEISVFSKVCCVGDYLRNKGVSSIRIDGCTEDTTMSDRVIYYHFANRRCDMVAAVVDGPHIWKQLKITRSLNKEMKKLEEMGAKTV